MTESRWRYRKYLLPFGLGFLLVALAAWLFVPWWLAPAPLQTKAGTGSRAVAELLPATQPDHVFFSPRAHSRDACNECHTFDDEQYSALFKLNKSSDSGDDTAQAFYQAGPMNMSECLDCHAIPAHLNTTTASQSCGTCHR